MVVKNWEPSAAEIQLISAAEGSPMKNERSQLHTRLPNLEHQSQEESSHTPLKKKRWL